MACEKSGIVPNNPNFNADANNWMNQFININVNYANEGVLKENAFKLASINDALVAYIEGATNDPSIVQAIINDVNNNTTTSTQPYQNNYHQATQYTYTAYQAAAPATATKTLNLQTGSVDNIAANLYTALRKYGNYSDLKYASDVSNLKNWVAAKYSTANQADCLELAEINNYVTNYINGQNNGSELANIYNKYKSNAKYTLPASNKAYTEYMTGTNITLNAQEQTYENDWDLTNPDVVDALAFYQAAKGGYILVSDENANSFDWLNNIIDMGAGIILEYDVKERKIFDTSVATNTGLQEAQDKTLLKKAEAQYEADMKRIDKKDRKYDSDLAALETERNAIKQELDTLKTVAKDNVERTFKLFS